VEEEKGTERQNLKGNMTVESQQNRIRKEKDKAKTANVLIRVVPWVAE